MDELKNCAKNFKIRSCALFNIWKRDEQKKIRPGILRLVGMLFLIFGKEMSKKTARRSLRFTSTLFLRFVKEMSKKIAQGISRFGSMLFLIFGKEMSLKIRKYAFLFNNWQMDEQENCPSNFKIRNYAFFHIWKSDEQKHAQRILRVVSFNISKRDKLAILRFVSKLF